MNPPTVSVVATDYLLDIDVPRYDINDAVGLADFVDECFQS